MNLHLVLTYHWFDEIESGRKRVEYREKKSYWIERVWANREQIKTVTFSRGYTSKTITFNVDKIDQGSCPYPEWDDRYIRIHFSTEQTEGLV